MKDIETAIIGVLESVGGKPMHRVDIQGALPGFGAASIDAYLSKLARMGTIESPKRSHFAVNPERDQEPRLPLWGNEKAAPFQRVIALLKEQGPMTRDTIRLRLPGLKECGRVLNDMAQAGQIHAGADGNVHLGTHPRRPEKITNSQRWNSDRLMREADTSSEEKERETAAAVTSEMPEAAAAPTPAGDAPDESADTESPAAAMGPSPAPESPTPKTREEATMPITNNAAEIAADLADVTQLHDEPLGNPGPRASFTMHSEGVRIIVEGDPSSVLKTVAAIDQAMMS